MTENKPEGTDSSVECGKTSDGGWMLSMELGVKKEEKPPMTEHEYLKLLEKALTERLPEMAYHSGDLLHNAICSIDTLQERVKLTDALANMVERLVPAVIPPAPADNEHWRTLVADATVVLSKYEATKPHEEAKENQEAKETQG